MEVDPTVETCTKGIWIWSRPIYSKKTDQYIFFMDTEGSGSVSKNQNYDVQIFTLSLLISSYFIYNSVGAIDERSISTMALISKLAQNIQVGEGEADSLTLSYYTPRYLWILRDFTLEIRDPKGNRITEAEYLEQALIQNSQIKTNQEIRESMLNYFKERDCITMVRPVFLEKDLNRLNSIPNRALRKQFLSKLNLIRQKILTKCPPKQINGVNLTIRMFCNLTQSYVQAINDGQIPNIQDAWAFILENECIEGYNQCIEVYNNRLRESLSSDESIVLRDLQALLRNHRDFVLNQFHKLAGVKGDNTEIYQEYTQKLAAYMSKKEVQAFQINTKKNETFNQILLKELSSEIKDNLTSNLYNEKNLNDFIRDYSNLLNNYSKGGIGTSQCGILTEFLANFNEQAVRKLIHGIKKDNKENSEIMQ